MIEYIGSAYKDRLILEESGPLVIYGFGKYGKRTYELLKNNDRLKHICCFCDVKYGGRGEAHEGIAILPPEEVLQKWPDARYLVSGAYAADMTRYLIKEQVPKIHVLFWDC